LLDGLSEQPAGHSASVSDPRRGVVSDNAISFVNKLLEKNYIDRETVAPNDLSAHLPDEELSERRVKRILLAV
jgi:hypothetical protein